MLCLLHEVPTMKEVSTLAVDIANSVCQKGLCSSSDAKEVASASFYLAHMICRVPIDHSTFFSRVKVSKHAVEAIYREIQSGWHELVDEGEWYEDMLDRGYTRLVSFPGWYGPGKFNSSSKPVGVGCSYGIPNVVLSTMTQNEDVTLSFPCPSQIHSQHSGGASIVEPFIPSRESFNRNN